VLRALCWLETAPPEPERQHYVNSMVPRKHVPPPTYRYAGELGAARVDPTAWRVRGWPTLREPRETVLAQVQNRDIYSILLSSLFGAPDGDGAFPRAFHRARPGHEAGCWWHLLPTARRLMDDDALVRTAVRRIFTSGVPQAMPLAVRQTVWQIRTAGLHLGQRTGGDGRCAIAASRGERVPETHLRVCVESPVARLLWRHLAHAWLAHSDDAWAGAIEADHWDDSTVRAVALGGDVVALHLKDAFALLRGLALHALVRHYMRASVALTADPDATTPIDAIAAAATLYEAVRVQLQCAVAHDYTRCDTLARQMRAAGLPPASCYGENGPVAGWRRAWLAPGVCAWRDGRLLQLLLPARPPAPIAPGPAVAAGAVHPAYAPPGTLPPWTHVVYIAATTGPGPWLPDAPVGVGYTILRDGDPGDSLDAALDTDGSAAVARVPSADAALLAALAVAMGGLPADGDTPVLLRPQSAVAAALLTGACDSQSDLDARERGCLRDARAALHALSTRRTVWVTAWTLTRQSAWGERALALAHGARVVGGLRPEDECAICMADYAGGGLPLPDPASRAAPGRWQCPHKSHCVCRGCDRDVELSANPRCPLCRAPRLLSLGP
jgi:hypothetical protein